MAVQFLHDLKQPETTGDRFARGFAGLGQSAASEFEKFHQNKTMEEQRQKKVQMVSQLAGRDASGLDDKTLDSLLTHAQGMEKQKSEYDFEGDLQRQKNELQNLNEKNNQPKKTLSKSTQKKPTKQDLKNEELNESHKTAQKAFNSMGEIIKANNIGRYSGFKSFFGGDTARESGKFQSLTAALEGLLVDKVNRGALSDTRFKYITETLLPKPTDSINEIKGKMEGLAEILDLDASVLGIEKSNGSDESQGLSGQFVDVIGPDGQIYEIDQSEVGELPEGYRVK